MRVSLEKHESRTSIRKILGDAVYASYAVGGWKQSYIDKM